MSPLDVDSTKEPDILALGLYDNPILTNDSDEMPLASITIIEIKRPGRNDKKDNPINQSFNYLKNIREGKIKIEGRPVYNAQEIPAFCYILCDLTESIKNDCANASLILAPDKERYFGYNPTHNAYIEVISFDQLVNSANKRNKAFFNKLGIPST